MRTYRVISFVGLLRVDDQSIELVAEEIADDPADELGFAANLSRSLLGVGLPLDLLPLLVQALELPLERLLRHLFAHGADNDARVGIGAR